MSASPSLLALRRQLATRFPTASRPAPGVLATGVDALDQVAGGVPRGAITEVVAAAPSCGVASLWHALLTAVRAARARVALVDGGDAFDAASFPADVLPHLVWVRGRSVAEALVVADLLARDANFLLVLLDLRHSDPRELRRLPTGAWYRLQRAAESAGLSLVVATPTASVPSAQLRLVLARPATLDELEQERVRLVASLAPAAQRIRRSLAAAG